jgi:hypothetical protein
MHTYYIAFSAIFIEDEGSGFILAILVIEFQVRGYKISKFLA